MDGASTTVIFIPFKSARYSAACDEEGDTMLYNTVIYEFNKFYDKGLGEPT
jgi:hypothetical protein